MNEFTVVGDKSLRPMIDGLMHALIRTQKVVSLAGNAMNGGVEEAVFDVKIDPIRSEDARIGSPATGKLISISTQTRAAHRGWESQNAFSWFWLWKLTTIVRSERWTSVLRRHPAQICRMADQARAEERDVVLFVFLNSALAGFNVSVINYRLRNTVLFVLLSTRVS
jgi:hypothetical protein